MPNAGVYPNGNLRVNWWSHVRGFAAGYCSATNAGAVQALYHEICALGTGGRWLTGTPLPHGPNGI